jgi:preprotein translocase subunit SecA
MDPDTGFNERAPALGAAGIPDGTNMQQREALPHSALPDGWERTSRNAPCPCGSGKKFKHCHGALV